MAVTFEIFLDRLADLEKFVEKVAPDVLLKHPEIVELANKQLLDGKNIENKLMQKGYSRGYAKLRQRKGLQTSFVDLKFTGKYQNTKKLVKYQYGVDIRSAADYEAHLRANFPNHVGLTKENADKLKQPVAATLAVEILNYLTK